MRNKKLSGIYQQKKEDLSHAQHFVSICQYVRLLLLKMSFIFSVFISFFHTQTGTEVDNHNDTDHHQHEDTIATTILYKEED